MKSSFYAAIMLLFLTGFCVAQTIVFNPKTGFSTAGNVQITKVELSDTATILSFDVEYTPNFWINVPIETYIQPVNSKEKYLVKYSEGIGINKHFYMPASGKTSYRLFFAALPKGTELIDFSEGEGGSWSIYDIALKSKTTKLLMPKELNTHWFNKSTGDLELSINNKFVVYKSKLWNVGQYKAGKTFSTLALTSKAGETTQLYFQAVKGDSCMMGESLKDMKTYSNNADSALKTAVVDNEPYKLPVFKLDTAVYCGYFKDYSPRMGSKTMSLYVNDLITGDQKSHLIIIDENGFFSVKVPMYYPQHCFVSNTFYNGAVFLEPGKSLFQLLDHSYKGAGLFMGDNARLNTDLKKLEHIRNFNYDAMRKGILDMSPAQYKAFCKEAEAKDLSSLNWLMERSKFTAKAVQVQKLDFMYNTMSNMMSYDMNYESAYREINKIPRTQRKLDMKKDSLTAEYFDFIKPEIVNNPIAVIASGYNHFNNRLKYLDIIRPSIKGFGVNTQQIADELAKSGYQFTPSETDMMTKLRTVDSIANSVERKEFNTRYSLFVDKYSLDSLVRKTSKASSKEIQQYLKSRKIKLTAEEKSLLKTKTKMDDSFESKFVNDFNSSCKDSLNRFNQKHREFINAYLNKKMQLARNEKLKSLLNVEAGFAVDIMNAQDITRKITSELTPITEQKLKAVQQEISTPFIAEYIAVCNNNTKAQLEANKKKTGYTVNETPKTEADKIFDAIMQKYRGKVVYVDFWATWCSPCRSSIQTIKPLKEEMDMSKVAFVYITNPSSPLTTWNNMIPDIKGEHYRVSQDEWNYLSSKFKITGIPHYALVSKDGTVINPQLGHLDNNAIKALLEKHVNE